MKKILVCVDFSESTQKLLGQAKSLASAFGAAIYVNYVATPKEDAGSNSDADLARDYPEECEAVNALATQLRQEGIDAHGVLVTGVPSEAIVSEVERLGVDLLVMGSHGKGLVAGTFLGSVSQNVIKRSRVPVHIIPVD